MSLLDFKSASKHMVTNIEFSKGENWTILQKKKNTGTLDTFYMKDWNMNLKMDYWRYYIQDIAK